MRVAARKWSRPKQGTPRGGLVTARTQTIASGSTGCSRIDLARTLRRSLFHLQAPGISPSPAGAATETAGSGRRCQSPHHDQTLPRPGGETPDARNLDGIDLERDRQPGIAGCIAVRGMSWPTARRLNRGRCGCEDHHMRLRCIVALLAAGLPLAATAAAVAAIRQTIEKRGLASRLLEVPGAPPVVFGELSSAGAKQTVVFYAHHDGQPVQEKFFQPGPGRAPSAGGRLKLKPGPRRAPSAGGRLKLQPGPGRAPSAGGRFPRTRLSVALRTTPPRGL
jgi:hypothetical protein